MIVLHTILIVSGLHDNDLTPLQMQEGEATTPENAIDDDVIDITTICKEMPQKTDINKPYIDNIDAYNRLLITTSLSNRLDLGQNSLPGAQQVRVAVKHTYQTSEFPEHLKQISLGEEIENISQTISNGNVSLIP